ncbi:YfeK family protein [Pseudomonas sp. HLT2-19-2]
MQTWIGAAARPISRLLIAAGISLIAIVTNAQAQATPQVTQEIKGLLDFVEHSECQFVRNGSEFPGPQARVHLEKKLNYLEGKNMVSSAEDFIDLAATKSSMSGRAYEVRCPEGVQPASTWLERELQRQRQLR